MWISLVLAGFAALPDGDMNSGIIRRWEEARAQARTNIDMEYDELTSFVDRAKPAVDKELARIRRGIIDPSAPAFGFSEPPAFRNAKEKAAAIKGGTAARKLLIDIKPLSGKRDDAAIAALLAKISKDDDVSVRLAAESDLTAEVQAIDWIREQMKRIAEAKE